MENHELHEMERQLSLEERLEKLEKENEELSHLLRAKEEKLRRVSALIVCKESKWKMEQLQLEEEIENLFKENKGKIQICICLDLALSVSVSSSEWIYTTNLTISDSPFLSRLVAPRGQVSGKELGTLMGNLISITALVVTRANKDIKTMAPVAFTTLGCSVLSTIFNNMVTAISMDPNAEIRPTLWKAVEPIPWVLVGGLIPLFVGGFIPQWCIRCIVTSVISLGVKLGLTAVWRSSYKIKLKTAVSIVLLGMVGTFVAAIVPQLIGMMEKGN